MTQINTNIKEQYFLKDETYNIVGAAMEVLNTLGNGLLEKSYENALVCELNLRNIPFKQQPRYNVMYKGNKVGEYIPDLIIYDSIVVDLKVIREISNNEISQVMNYLKITGNRLGLILNFSKTDLEWKRVII